MLPGSEAGEGSRARPAGREGDHRRSSCSRQPPPLAWRGVSSKNRKRSNVALHAILSDVRWTNRNSRVGLAGEQSKQQKTDHCKDDDVLGTVLPVDPVGRGLHRQTGPKRRHEAKEHRPDVVMLLNEPFGLPKIVEQNVEAKGIEQAHPDQHHLQGALAYHCNPPYAIWFHM